MSPCDTVPTSVMSVNNVEAKRSYDKIQLEKVFQLPSAATHSDIDFVIKPSTLNLPSMQRDTPSTEVTLTDPSNTVKATPRTIMSSDMNSRCVGALFSMKTDPNAVTTGVPALMTWFRERGTNIRLMLLRPI